MCGRFTMNKSHEEVTAQFAVQESLFTATPRYNIAPSQTVAVVLEKGGRCLEGLRWGLIPSWSKDPKMGHKMINARGETLGQKPAFRSAYKRRRCLVPTSGFYEWQKQGSQKRPMFIHLPERPLFGMAGLWEEWQGADASIVRTLAIITVEANPFMETIHHRMPAILSPEDETMWLDPTLEDTRTLQELLKPHSSEGMAAYEVSKHVNSPANDDARCLEKQEGLGGSVHAGNLFEC